MADLIPDAFVDTGEREPGWLNLEGEWVGQTWPLTGGENIYLARCNKEGERERAL